MNVGRMPSKSQQRRSKGTAERAGTDTWTVASAASVALALYVFFVSKDREMGVFVGLWAPTILAFASYLKQQRTYDAIHRTMEGSGVIERMERLVQNQ